MSGRSGAAIFVAIGALASARPVGAETINLSCLFGLVGPPVIVHLDLDALTAQMIWGKYPTLDAQKYPIVNTEPEVKWRFQYAMGYSEYRYNRALDAIKETAQGEYGGPEDYTWPCVKIPAKP